MNVYDFDNTIYDGESTIDFFFFYLKRDPSLIQYTPAVMRVLYKYKRGHVSIDEALRTYGGKVTEYYLKMEKDLPNMVKDFWDSHEKNIKPLYKELQQKDDLIISGSPEVFLNEICNRLGVKRYIGTLLDPVTGDIIRLCFKEAKVKAFLEQYDGHEIDNFYTDSLFDMPLIELSKNAYLVKGTKIEKIK